MNLIRHKVLDLIRSEILSCTFQPGEELREADLADRYDVSKSPVREALQYLKFEGLVETEPRRGHRVTPISVSDAHDILDMREALELAATRKIAKDASDETLKGFDAWREADVSDIRAFASYNRAFHIVIAEASGNRRLLREVRRLLDAYERLCLVSLERLRDDQGDMREALSDHCVLIDSLQARDARAAARISERHLRRSRRQIIKGLENRPIVD
ncbi:GntR family transcriptional regulator [Roseisalinus antarcticus]|uniref:HTH-type transcriptional repressor CsiR n=1 Tax=Roseisalinus antarcticus TaxID=254357 RepID=A0A1Y5S9R4_9RHOB|nr:GntR family transcriptional regulator [Roseisalinus antarcticus]SLN34195.1 HTH-type transcriptional repressor CsiR [Roseisalinus antarcticus]